MDTTTILPPAVGDTSTFGLTPLKPDILPEIRIPGGSSVSIFIVNRDVNNFIEMNANETAEEYNSGDYSGDVFVPDGIVTVKTGVFQRYGDFVGNDIGSW